jgi:hypothetical protein
MPSLRSCLIVAALVLSGLAAGCERKPQPMPNMRMETGRNVDTRPIKVRPGKEIPSENGGPAAPPLKQ